MFGEKELEKELERKRQELEEKALKEKLKTLELTHKMQIKEINSLICSYGSILETLLPEGRTIHIGPGINIIMSIKNKITDLELFKVNSIKRYLEQHSELNQQLTLLNRYLEKGK